MYSYFSDSVYNLCVQAYSAKQLDMLEAEFKVRPFPEKVCTRTVNTGKIRGSLPSFTYAEPVFITINQQVD